MKEFFLQCLQLFKIHHLRHRKLHCTFTFSYSLCHCRSSHHWQCSTVPVLEPSKNRSLMPSSKVQKFVWFFWDRSIANKESILLTTSNAINVKMQGFISIHSFVKLKVHSLWWIVIPQDAWSAVICKTFSGQINIIYNTNMRKVQGPTQSSKSSHRFVLNWTMYFEDVAAQNFFWEGMASSSRSPRKHNRK